MRYILIFIALLAFSATPSLADWSEVASLPGQGRHHPVTFTLDGYGYVATGSAAGDTYTDDFFRYDPINDSWEVLPAFPGPDRSYAYGGSYGGKGYLGFGTTPSYLNDLWEYDPVEEEWTQLASLPGQGRAHPAFVITDDGKIFVGLGNWAQNLRDWWEYDISNNIWTERTLLPGPARHHPYYFNLGDTPYAGLGHGGAIYSDFYRWNRDTDTWTTLASFPGEGRVAGTQFSHGVKGYILSGEGADHAQLETGEFWEYDALDDSWTELTPHPGSGRWAPGSFLIDDTIYFLGGLSTTRLENDMWKFEMMRPAAVENIALDSDHPFLIYPNPVSGGRLHLLRGSSGKTATAGIGSIRLLDVRGREVAKLTNTATGVEIPRVSPGRYFIGFTTEDGSSHASPIMVVR